MSLAARVVTGYSLMLTLASLALGGMLLGVETPFGTLFPHRALLLVFAGLLLLVPAMRSSLRNHARPLLMLAIGILSYFLIGTLVAQRLDMGVLVRWLEFYLLFALGAVCREMLAERAEKIAWVVCMGCLAINLMDVVIPGSVANVITSLSLPKTAEQVRWIQDITLFRGATIRLRGTFYHSLSLGAFAATTVAYVVELLRRKRLSVVAGSVSIAGAMAVAFFTLSRSSLLSSMALVALYGATVGVRRIRTRRHIIVVILVAVGVLLLGYWLLLTGTMTSALDLLLPNGVYGDVSLGMRANSRQFGIDLFLSSPVWGHGIGYLRSHGLILDNYALFTLAEGGLIGGVFLSLTLAFVTKSMRIWPLALLCALQFVSFDFWGFWDSGGVFWLLCGILQAPAGKLATESALRLNGSSPRQHQGATPGRWPSGG